MSEPIVTRWDITLGKQKGAPNTYTATVRKDGADVRCIRDLEGMAKALHVRNELRVNPMGRVSFGVSQ